MARASRNNGSMMPTQRNTVPICRITAATVLIPIVENQIMLYEKRTATAQRHKVPKQRKNSCDPGGTEDKNDRSGGIICPIHDCNKEFEIIIFLIICLDDDPASGF